MQRTLSALVITSSLLLTGLPTAVVAQQNPGFTFGWGDGIPGSRQLPFHLDNGAPSNRDRYRLKIPRKKAPTAISQFLINYPDYYRGKFDAESIKVLVNGDQVPLEPVNLDLENRIIEITPRDVIAAGNSIEIVMSNVKNPAHGGMYYFNCRVNTPGDIPLSQYVGTWILSIYRS